MKLYQPMNSLSTLALTAGIVLAGCGPSDTDTNGNGNSSYNSDTSSGTDVFDVVNINGSVQKGPFIQGSDVQIYLLDANGNNLGSVYNTQTTDNVGNFSTTLAGLTQNYTGNVTISSNGFFFKEAAGNLSNAQQTLKALYLVNGQQADINVNLITHLSYLRTANLLKGNSNLDSSVSQANDELILSLEGAGLYYPSSNVKVGTSMDLFGVDSDENNYLLAVSCVFENAVASSDSKLQELLNNYQADLADDGTINLKLVDVVKAGVVKTDPIVCVDNLQKRGHGISVNFNLSIDGMNTALDTDLDGIVNSKDTDIDGDGVENNLDPEPYNPLVKKTVDPLATYCISGFCWEKTPSTKLMTLSEAFDYCNNLDDKNNSWRLPYMSELISLIKGCPDSEIDGENWTCGKYYYKCVSSCETSKGQAKDGCYWDFALEGQCGTYHSQEKVNNGTFAVDFTKATWMEIDAKTPALVRCVR